MRFAVNRVGVAVALPPQGRECDCRPDSGVMLGWQFNCHPNQVCVAEFCIAKPANAARLAGRMRQSRGEERENRHVGLILPARCRRPDGGYVENVGNEAAEVQPPVPPLSRGECVMFRKSCCARWFCRRRRSCREPERRFYRQLRYGLHHGRSGAELAVGKQVAGSIPMMARHWPSGGIVGRVVCQLRMVTDRERGHGLKTNRRGTTDTDIVCQRRHVCRSVGHRVGLRGALLSSASPVDSRQSWYATRPGTISVHDVGAQLGSRVVGTIDSDGTGHYRTLHRRAFGTITGYVILPYLHPARGRQPDGVRRLES